MSWVKAVGHSGEDVFDEDADDITLQNKEWKYNMEKRGKDGYRDGMDAGKEKSLQLGFNLGYKTGAAKMVGIGHLKGMISAVQCWCQIQNPDRPVPASLTELLQRVVKHEGSLINVMVKVMERPPPTLSDVSEGMEDLGVVEEDKPGCGGGEACQAADCCRKGGHVDDVDPDLPQKPCSTSADPEESFEELVRSFMDVVTELGLPQELIQHLQELKTSE